MFYCTWTKTINTMMALKFRQSLINYFGTQLKNVHSLKQVRSLHSTDVLDKRISFKLSDIGEGIREVSIKEWLVKEGDVVEQFDNLCEVQSDKASVTITSRYDGKILKLHHKVDDIALVGHPLLDFEVADDDDGDDGDEDTSSSDSDSSASESSSTSRATSRDVVARGEGEEAGRLITLATPAVRRIAKEHRVDLSKVRATGKHGRVLKGDVLEHLGLIPTGSTTTTSTSSPTSVGSGGSVSTTATLKPVPLIADRLEQLKGVRKAMLKSMAASLNIPHFAYSDEIEMSKLMDFRNQLKDVAMENGIGRLTFMPFCIKAASIALTKYPILNSSLDLEQETIIYKAAHNISVAIDTPQGLVVPNIKNCQVKNIIEIAQDLNDLIERGRKGSLAPDDFANGTFSISNIGVIGGTYTHPVILSPQVCIGAMGRTKAVPRFNSKDEVIKAHIMSVSWSADHRVIDGVTMASFSNLWKMYLENPALFLLN